MLMSYEEALEQFAVMAEIRADDRRAAQEALFGRFDHSNSHYYASTNPAQKSYVPTTKPRNLKTWKFVIGYKTRDEAALFAMCRSSDRLDMRRKELWTTQKNVNILATRRFWLWEFDGTDMRPFIPDGLIGDRWTKINSYRSTDSSEFSNIKIIGEFDRESCAKLIGWKIHVVDPAPPKPGGLSSLKIHSG